MTNAQQEPEAVAGQSKPAAGEIMDKKSYGQRWQFKPRMVDNFLAEGLPHLKIGKRRVRIVVAEADQWMRERYGTQRTKAA